MTDQVKSQFDILIVGSGYTGLAMALALSARLSGDTTIALLDRKPLTIRTDEPDPRASALAAGSRNLLANLGIWNDIKDHAQPVRHIDITDPIGDSALRQILLSYDNELPDGEPASWIIPNDRIRTALAKHVLADPKITILPNEEMKSFQAISASAKLTVESGATYKAGLVLAADGGRSPLRQCAGIKTTGWSYKQAGIVTTVSHARPHNATATQHFLPAGPFAILPLKGNRSSIVWTEEQEEAKRIMQLPDEGFRGAVDARIGSRLGEIEVSGPRASWPLRLQVARTLVAPRLALLGDAARTVHPIAGQGLNIALRDVAALTEVVREAAKLGLDPGGGETLRRYQQWRRFDAVVSALTFDGINRLFSNDSILLRTARDFGLGLVQRSPALKKLFVQEAAGLTGDIPALLEPDPGFNGT